MSNESASNSVDSPLDSSPPWFRFGDSGFVTARSVAPEHVSATANNAFDTIIFDDLLADLSTDDGPLTAVTSVHVEVPVAILGSDPFLGYKIDFRGTCIKSAGSRAALLAQVGGATHAEIFQYDDVRGGDDTDWQALVFSFEQRPNKDSGVPVIPLPPLSIDVTISVQRRTTDESVTLALDSIDVTAVRLV